MAVTKTLTNFKSRLEVIGPVIICLKLLFLLFQQHGIDFWKTGDDENSTKMAFLCKTSQLPTSTVASIPVPFRGRELKVAWRQNLQALDRYHHQ